jgi:hypothetical protein
MGDGIQSGQLRGSRLVCVVQHQQLVLGEVARVH